MVTRLRVERGVAGGIQGQGKADGPVGGQRDTETNGLRRLPGGSGKVRFWEERELRGRQIPLKSPHRSAAA